jgi:type IV secretion system T-DNA border endonuclease VirD1
MLDVALEGARAESGTTEQPHAQNHYKIICIRLRSAEYEDFYAQAQALGLTANMALRIAARRIGGFLEIDCNAQSQLSKITRDIGEISRAIASLHCGYVQSGKVDVAGLARQRQEFGAEFARLDSLLRSIQNVARRRTDGKQRLMEAMK